MDFIRLFITCIILIPLFLIVSAIFGGWGLLIGLAFIVAAAIAGFMELSERITRIEQHLGLETPKEETMTLTEKWEAERRKQEENEN